MKGLGRRAALVLVLVAAVVAVLGAQQPQAGVQVIDPGPRAGTGFVGGPRAGLNAYYSAFFTAAQARFQEVDSVATGLGPGFNSRSCAECHAQPAVGGTSPVVNPQVEDATDSGGQNVLPEFITLNGPVREVRFVTNPDGTPDGGVHDLFTIQGRSDAGSCVLQQPNFAAAVAQGNAIFRIPTPVFGLGLVEEITDANIEANQVVTPLKRLLGITGVANHSGNTGNVTRFGWKGQNPSLDVFAGEAYNVEQGVTNERFPVERESGPGCNNNALPEDQTSSTDVTNGASPASGYSSDIVNFATFARLLAPPTPAPPTLATIRGSQIFSAIGCALCHTPTMATGVTSSITGLTNETLSPYSDFLLHNMGLGLQDRVSQGGANGQQFRSAPLWGVGQRIFFLHDGRCGPQNNGLVCAIEAHASQGSEATVVVQLFNRLSPQQQQQLVLFLRSL